MSSPIYYLYVKTHNITGLKYLGQTVKDPFTYKGSGLHWKRHLKTHGKDISTELIAAFDSKENLREAGLFWSKYWNVVDSEEWANLCEEDGSSTTGLKASKETKQKMSLSQKGKVGYWNGLKRSKEHKNKISLTLKSKGGNKSSFKKGHKTWNKGISPPKETKQKMSLSYNKILHPKNSITGRFLPTNISINS